MRCVPLNVPILSTKEVKLFPIGNKDVKLLPMDHIFTAPFLICMSFAPLVRILEYQQ